MCGRAVQAKGVIPLAVFSGIDVHDRMPLILRREDFDRWLGIEPDSSDLLRPFAADAMTMWPISTRVNSPRNDDADLLTPMPRESSASPNGGPNPL
jgi:hypothetical protein